MESGDGGAWAPSFKPWLLRKASPRFETWGPISFFFSHCDVHDVFDSMNGGGKLCRVFGSHTNFDSGVFGVG